MARHLSNLPREYMCKFHGLQEYLSERPDINGYALIDDVMLCGVLLMEPSRIHYVLVPEECRRGGYGTELVNYAVNSLSDKGRDVLARVPGNDQRALSFMISCGFEIVGWSLNNSDDRGYLLSHRRNKLPVVPMSTDAMAASVLEMVDKLLVVETLPVRYAQI